MLTSILLSAFDRGKKAFQRKSKMSAALPLLAGQDASASTSASLFLILPVQTETSPSTEATERLMSAVISSVVVAPGGNLKQLHPSCCGGTPHQ